MRQGGKSADGAVGRAGWMCACAPRRMRGGPAGVRRGRTLGWVGRWTGRSPSNLHGGQLRRARARRAAAQLQASCPLSAGQGPCPPLEQTALWPSEKSQRSAQGRTCQLGLSGAHARQAARAEGNRALAGALLAAHLAATIASKGATQAASVPNLCARRAGSGGSGQR